MKMTSGRRQHIVPQMMIRRFAADDGKLIELLKPSLRIATRRRSPRGILFEGGIYSSGKVDLDADLFQVVEKQFACVYPRLARGDASAVASGSRAAAALVHWIASMLCRTRAQSDVLKSIIEAGRLPARSTATAMSLLAQHPADLIGRMRVEMFKSYVDLLTRPRWEWGVRVDPGPSELVLTDTPVLLLPVPGGQALAVVLPLSKHGIVIGALGCDWHIVEQLTTDDLNLMLGAHANRSVFAGDAATLEAVRRGLLRPSSHVRWPVDSHSTLPLNGLLERLRAGCVPNDSEEPVWDRMKDEYGPSLRASRSPAG